MGEHGSGGFDSDDSDRDTHYSGDLPLLVGSDDDDWTGTEGDGNGPPAVVSTFGTFESVNGRASPSELGELLAWTDDCTWLGTDGSFGSLGSRLGSRLDPGKAGTFARPQDGTGEGSAAVVTEVAAQSRAQFRAQRRAGPCHLGHAGAAAGANSAPEGREGCGDWWEEGRRPESGPPRLGGTCCAGSAMAWPVEGLTALDFRDAYHSSALIGRNSDDLVAGAPAGEQGTALGEAEAHIGIDPRGAKDEAWMGKFWQGPNGPEYYGVEWGPGERREQLDEAGAEDAWRVEADQIATTWGQDVGALAAERTEALQRWRAEAGAQRWAALEQQPPLAAAGGAKRGAAGDEPGQTADRVQRVAAGSQELLGGGPPLPGPE